VYAVNWGTDDGMAGDPRRIVEELEDKVRAEEGDPQAGDDLPTPAAEDASLQTPGVEPTD
jgi:hypothetical protein